MDLGFDIQEKIDDLGKVPRSIRMAAVAGVLLACGAGYYMLSYQESQAKLASLNGTAQELQRKLNKVRTVADNLGDFEAEVAGLERELTKALKQLPNKRQFEDLLQDISTAGKKTGVEVRSIGRAKEVPHKFYAEVPFKLTLSGTYHDIAHFFEQVSRLPRIVNVGALHMSRGDSKSGRLRVEGTARTYRFVEQKAGGKKKKKRKKKRR